MVRAISTTAAGVPELVAATVAGVPEDLTAANKHATAATAMQSTAAVAATPGRLAVPDLTARAVVLRTPFPTSPPLLPID